MSSAADRIEHLAQIGHVDEARRQARAALAAEPEDAELLSALAYTLYQAGEHEEGLSAARAACAAAPDDERAHRLRGLHASKLGRHDEAVAACRRSVSLSPHTAAPVITLAEVLWIARRLAEALESARRSVELAPHSADAHCGLADVLDDLGHTEAARAAYHEALRLEPEHPSAGINLAALDMKENRLGTALRGLLAAGAAHPNLRGADDVFGYADPKLPFVLDSIIVVGWNALAWVQVGLTLSLVAVFQLSIVQPGVTVQVAAGVVPLLAVVLVGGLIRRMPRGAAPVLRAALRGDRALAIAYVAAAASLPAYLAVAVTGSVWPLAAVAVVVVLLWAINLAVRLVRARRARRRR